jgi:endoglucanase
MRSVRWWSWVLGLAAAAVLLPACGGGGGGGSLFQDRTPVDLTGAYPDGSPVKVHGQLSVAGTVLHDAGGDTVQLRGVSSHGLQWYPGFMNQTAFDWMEASWDVSVVRAAMYVTEGGFESSPETSVSKVERIVRAAAGAGVYVIVDWHVLNPGDPRTYADDAARFFDYMSARYGANPHVIFEIANEPNGADVTWAGSVKPYAERIIPIIRANAPSSIIIVGSPHWSQDVHIAADDPLTAEGGGLLPDVMYTVHFYAGTHGAWLRDRITYAEGKGLAVFVTEWGTTDASGTGPVYPTEATDWITFLDGENVSWCNWSLSDKAEGSALLVPGAGTGGGWGDGKLTDSGKLVRSLLLSPPQPE